MGGDLITDCGLRIANYGFSGKKKPKNPQSAIRNPQYSHNKFKTGYVIILRFPFRGLSFLSPTPLKASFLSDPSWFNLKILDYEECYFVH